MEFVIKLLFNDEPLSTNAMTASFPDPVAEKPTQIISTLPTCLVYRVCGNPLWLVFGKHGEDDEISQPWSH